MNKLFTRLAVACLAVLTMVGLVSGTAQSAPTPAPAPTPVNAPEGYIGKQVQAPFKAGETFGLKSEAPKGSTKTVKIDEKTGVPAATAGIAADTSINFTTFYNYAWRELSYTGVTNYSGVTKYIHVQLYVPAQGDSTSSSYRDFYTSVPPGTKYPYFYGVSGNYSAYLYVWNGSYYAYDEYKAGSNITNVTATIAKSAYSGYVLVTFRNYGNNYVTINSEELAPFNVYGTYTGGPHYDYPGAGGGVISRYYYVGVGYRYGIVADVDGSYYNSFRFAGVY